jgi:hypothetical protein
MQSWKDKFQHHLDRKELVFFIVNCSCFETRMKLELCVRVGGCS